MLETINNSNSIKKIDWETFKNILKIKVQNNRKKV